MTEKLLFEFQALKMEGGYRYKIRRGKRTSILREQKGEPVGKGRCVKMYKTKRSNIRQALETLENLYDELYPLG
jgi:hypothetical protein